MPEPVEYMPEALRPRRKISRKLEYGIGIPDGNSSFGMTNGPVENLQEMLNVIPHDVKSVIIRFNEDQSDDVIYKWNHNRWIRVDPDIERLSNFHWDPSKLDKSQFESIPSIPITVSDVKGKEQWQERVMRMLYQVSNVVRSCSMCSLGRQLCDEHNTVFDPHVFSTMNPSRLVVVGQNPGFNECLQGRPFVGDAGKFFDEAIVRHGLSRNDFYITNLVKCYTIGNNRPTKEHMVRCESILRMEITLLRPLLVITLGSVAFEAFFHGMTLSEHLGDLMKSDKFDVEVYPMYHPSPRNMQDSVRRAKFIDNINDLCELIKAYRSSVLNS
jgi:DNA polymerase